MTNLEWLQNANEEEIARFLIWLIKNPDYIDDEFCKECKLKDSPLCSEQGCQFTEEAGVAWWLKKSLKKTNS